ncbi:hypothetical protein RF11_15911 [Thelohanellus kitauei]|uniref:Exocyst complex subunit Exo70 C-terminal domain-containing protein n=1 Tax=Thelohanellus kitauei TaxID=669202 RepID=A0A0C2MD61_THEKT|nr:hypothetical protein RF11_15911 [Thelohanellus kitauei]
MSEKLKECKKIIYNVGVSSNTLDEYLKALKIVKESDDFLQTNCPLFPEHPDWKILHKESVEILTNLTHTSLTKTLDNISKGLIELAEAWVTHGSNPSIEQFGESLNKGNGTNLLLVVENMSTLDFPMIISVLHNIKKVEALKDRFIKSRTSDYSQIIRSVTRDQHVKGKAVINFDTSLSSTRLSPEDGKKPSPIISPRNSTISASGICLMIFETTLNIPLPTLPTTSKAVNANIEDIMKTNAVCILIMKVEKIVVEKMFPVDLQKEIFSNLYFYFLNELTTMAKTFEMQMRSFLDPENSEMILKTLNTVLPTISFTLENQATEMTLAEFGCQEEISSRIFKKTKSLESFFCDILDMVLKKLSNKYHRGGDDLNECGLFDVFQKTNEMLILIQKYKRTVVYIYSNISKSIRYSDINDSHNKYMQAATATMLDIFFKFPKMAEDRFQPPLRQIVLLNHAHLIINSLSSCHYQDFASQNTLESNSTEMDKLMQSCVESYINYWKQGYQELFDAKSYIGHVVDEVRVTGRQIKAKEKKMIKTAFMNFREFTKQALEFHESIVFYIEHDKNLILPIFKRQIINPCVEAIKFFSGVPFAKKPQKHIKYSDEEISKLLQDVLAIKE